MKTSEELTALLQTKQVVEVVVLDDNYIAIDFADDTVLVISVADERLNIEVETTYNE